MNALTKLVPFCSRTISKIQLNHRSQLVTSVLPRPLIMDPPTNDNQYQPEVKPVSSILNTNIDVSLDILRKEFSKVGKGTFELRKDEETGVALLSINNVERRNSLSGLMMAQFNDVLTQLEEWKEVMFLIKFVTIFSHVQESFLSFSPQLFFMVMNFFQLFHSFFPLASIKLFFE